MHFPASRVLRIMEQTCSALQFAHERNIVHRDIKPANMMLTADDTVKVTDFGTAKILQFGTVQQTTHVMGTPSYMSPEQVKGRPGGRPQRYFFAGRDAVRNGDRRKAVSRARTSPRSSTKL